VEINMAVMHALVLMAAAAIGDRLGGVDSLVPAGGQQGTKVFSLSIDGSPGARVVAACLVDWGQDADIVSLKGEVPLTRKVEAVGLACQIKKVSRGGRILIEVRRNGRLVSRNAAAGSSSVISISVQ
jgi:hypothetical protein